MGSHHRDKPQYHRLIEWCVGLQHAAKFFSSSHCILGSVAIEEQTDLEHCRVLQASVRKSTAYRKRSMQPSQKGQYPTNSLPAMTGQKPRSRHSRLCQKNRRRSPELKGREDLWWITSPVSQSAVSSGSNSCSCDNRFWNSNNTWSWIRGQHQNRKPFLQLTHGPKQSRTVSEAYHWFMNTLDAVS